MEKNGCKVRKWITGLFIAVPMLLITGCSEAGGPTGTGGISAGSVEYEADGGSKATLYSGAGVKVSGEEAKAADDFASSLRIVKGMGDYELTAIKSSDGIGDFVLKVKNCNDYPASALVECLFKDSSGNVLTAATQATSVIVPGAEDILRFSFGDDLLTGGYDSVEISAYTRKNNADRMIDNYSSSNVKLTTGKIESGGMYDGWHRVEVEIKSSGSVTGNADTFFYDADGYLIYSNNVWTSGSDKKFNVYCEEPFDHCEVIVYKLLDNVPDTPDSVYEEYKAAGFNSTVNSGETLHSPDGMVEYYFFTAKDGTILLHAINTSDSRVNWYVNDAIIYSGNRNKSTANLYMNPGEEIIWVPGFEKGSEFWLMNPCAYAVADSTVTPPIFEVADSEESGKEVTVNIEESVETLSDDWYNTLKCSATVVYYLNGEIVGGEYKGFPEEDLYYRRTGEYPLDFDGEYDTYEIYGQYEESNYSEPMY